MSLLIDTNVAILLRDADETIVRRLSMATERWCVSLVTLIELEGGVADRSDQSKRRRTGIDALLGQIALVPLDRSIVDAYAEMLSRVGFSRRKILDRLIAATAIVHDLTLVTMNGDDFCDIPGLRLDVWPAPQ